MSTNILIRGFENNLKSFTFDSDKIKTFKNLKEFVLDISNDDFILVCNGVNKRDEDEIGSVTGIYEVRKLELGGKGGFGSLLKGQPPVKKRTNNFDSCRDLSGRRLRHVNQEKMVKEWQQKKMEEERLIKQYNNPEDEKDVKDALDEDKRKEVMNLNKKFIVESFETTKSVSDSLKFLNRKRKKIAEKSIQPMKVEIKKVEYPTNTKRKCLDKLDCLDTLDQKEIEKLDKENLENQLLGIN
jgi:hypothetical protein